MFDLPDDDDEEVEGDAAIKKEEDTDTDNDGSGKKKAAVVMEDVPQNESAKAPSKITSQAGTAETTSASRAVATTHIGSNPILDDESREALKAIQRQMQELLANQATMMSSIGQIQKHLGLNKNGVDKSGGGDDNQKKDAEGKSGGSDDDQNKKNADEKAS